MGLSPWLLLLAKTGVAAAISPASASTIAILIPARTAAPLPGFRSAGEIRAFTPFVQGSWAGSSLGDDRGPRELAARDARDRELLGEERDADGRRAGRSAVDDRAGDIVVGRPEDVVVGASVEVVVLAVERSGVVDRGHVQARV